MGKDAEADEKETRQSVAALLKALELRKKYMRASLQDRSWKKAARAHGIAVNHVPAYPSFRKFETDGGKAGTGELNRVHWVPLFERHNVDLVLEHHDHTFKRTRLLLAGTTHPNGVLYLGDGSWGRLRNPQPPDKLTHLSR